MKGRKTLLAETSIDPRLGFEVPFPMAEPAPGVVDLVRLHALYAQQMSVYEAFVSAATGAETVSETNTTNVLLSR